MRKSTIIFNFLLLILLSSQLYAGAGRFEPDIEEIDDGVTIPPVTVGETEDILEQEEGTYFITAGDIILVKLPDEEEFKEYEVNFDGQLTIPEFGTFMTEGLTVEELEKTIFFDMPIYLRKIGEVEAQIKLKQKYVQVLGHVREPGWVLLNENVGPQGAIERAGGSIDGTVLDNIKLYRKIYGLEKTSLKTMTINLYRFKILGDINILPQLKSKDIVVVPMTSRLGNIQRSLGDWHPVKEELEISTQDKIRILGEVRSPKFLTPIKGNNVLDVIISAGGYKSTADLSNVSILEKLKSGGYRARSIDLENYIKTQKFEEIPTVTAGELVYIPRRRESTLKQIWSGSINVLRDVAVILTSIATIVVITRN